jgi:hypothetical protein
MALPHEAVRSRRTARLLAAFLAVGGLVWGAWCLWLAVSSGQPLALVIFAPGYLVTAGSLVLAVATPPLRRRRFLWKLAVVVQAAWLVWFLWEEAEHNFGVFSWFVVAYAGWWAVATAAAVAGFAIDAHGQR